MALRLCLLASLLGFLSPRPLFADGMMIVAEPVEPKEYADRWDFHEESDQQAHISYEDGVETMILRVGMERPNLKDLIWIFPVPSEPARVDIDVTTDYPELEGEEITKKVKSAVYLNVKGLRATQVHLPFLGLAENNSGKLFFGLLAMAMGWTMGSTVEDSADVVVHKHIEKEGIASEVVTARTSAGLYGYLKSKGLPARKTMIPVLDHYIGKGYSFVASWIKKSTGGEKRRGISVSFPTEKLFFPLLPTSVYGDREIPIVVRVIGHVTPLMSHDMRDFSKVEYFLQGSSLKYTKIEINAPAKRLTEDLWLLPKAPLRARYYSFLGAHPFVTGMAHLLGSMLCAGFLVGWLVFKEWRNRKGVLKMLVLASCNCLTILGLLLVTALIKTKGLEGEEKAAVEARRAKGSRFWAAIHAWVYQAMDPRKLVYIPLYSIVFLLAVECFARALVAWP
ncbi:MAG: hypothetical protein ABII00_04720 [Elusimicrobiota bacterium]